MYERIAIILELLELLRSVCTVVVAVAGRTGGALVSTP